MRIILLAMWITVFSLLTAHAQPVSKDVNRFIDSLVKEEGFNRLELQSLFQQVQADQEVISRISKPAESLSWEKYRPILVKQKKVEAGHAFYKKYHAILKKAEKMYGVPAELIVAVLGIETHWGKNQGKHSVLEGLYTLSFHYPKHIKRQRADFFRKELKMFLLLCREQQWNPLAVKGSYAGAMGMAQFISSSYRNYAIDFDEDGRVNLFNSVSDAIGSVAHYFKKHGWKNNHPVAEMVVAKGSVGSRGTTQGLIKPEIPVAQLYKQGLVMSQLWGPDEEAVVYDFSTTQLTEHWVTAYNFYVITRYNHSPMYAMAAFQLSQLIKRYERKTKS